MADGNQRFQRSFRHCVLFGVAWTLVISALFAGARLLAGKTVQALPVSPVLAVLGVLAVLIGLDLGRTGART